MNEYLTGRKLYGNNLEIDLIKKWYEEESEAYANIDHKGKTPSEYSYHNLNIVHGFSKLPAKRFNKVLGFGAARGYEIEPIIESIEHLIIVEPSEQLISKAIKHIIPEYVKPTPEGKLNFEDRTFDLITCFGTLHHIPNVGFVLSEMIRVLKPDGFLLLREPVQSMGDWRAPRPGLTKNERGIPLNFFETLFSSQPVEVISRSFCFSLTTHIKKVFGRLFQKPLQFYKPYVLFDKFISGILKFNLKYHPTKRIDRIAPNSVFYVLKKK
ncbi:class I SAM-dependent methyltransferase [Marinilabilia salmonicolor]|uniref:class I SAM-dependent methyltransferase n=1 Tax=Marinilabilia salmonicolor TaxID=989 RepID=UPI00029A2D64|nr:class I SAM-dependent methyltransferase [Marinilabilia salmonicolor]